jgi:hypothetical protein
VEVLAKIQLEVRGAEVQVEMMVQSMDILEPQIKEEVAVVADEAEQVERVVQAL